ncbi:hypothetical protein GGI16_003034 [Coemansia sp. S142-1]|nr:hypothetical protein GGI16_003034 [Coemansia sp. S142-1]
MGLTRPLFQTLPMLIVRKVIEYLEGRSRTSFDIDINKHNEKKAVLAPLLMVSEGWRTAALESICDNCTIAFNYSSRAIKVTIPAWPASFSYPRFRKSRLVKRVVVPLYLRQFVCDGAFCEALSTIHTTTVTTKENVVDFARSLLRLTPVARNVSLWFLSFSETGPSYEKLYDALVSELYKGKVTSLDVRYTLGQAAQTLASEFPLSLGLQGISELTSIAHGPDVSRAPFARLAYHNAATLKMLDIEIAEEKNWLDLIYGGTEVSAIYSELESLSLKVVVVPYTTTWAAVNDAALFSKLLTLDLSGGYPFDDDLIFRGNGGTLQYLQIPFGAIAQNTLGRFGGLKRSEVTRMNRISIGEVTVQNKAFVDGSAEVPIEQQVQHMLEVAVTLKQDEDTTSLRMYRAIRDTPGTATLQHLELRNIRILTSSIIKVVSAIPSLASCSCNLFMLGLFEDIPVEERPSRLHKKYYPLSSNFRTWRVLDADDKDTPIDIIVHSAMLLAVLCPNFVHVDLPLKLRNDFGRKIAWASFNGPFKPYAESVGRLVYREVPIQSP